jgi:hypothetical protein
MAVIDRWSGRSETVPYGVFDDLGVFVGRAYMPADHVTASNIHHLSSCISYLISHISYLTSPIPYPQSAPGALAPGALLDQE